MSELSDDLLISKWVQAMHAALFTGHSAWKDEVASLHGEILHRRLGLRALNVKMA
jgi:hypothetical protein